MNSHAGYSHSARDRDEMLPGYYRRVRARSETLCAPLATEDYVIQTIAEVSPPKWHLAHTTWFFETFLLKPHLPGYKVFHPRFEYLFNSYYNAVGAQYPRPQRGLLSRPTVEEVFAYRSHVDEHIARLLAVNPAGDVASLLALGLNHEQQHQELMLMDIKNVFAHNPLRPGYRELPTPAGEAPALTWLDFDGGVKAIGHEGDGFFYDNEGPRHQVYVNPFRLASRPVTNGEFMEFIEAGGYRQPTLWLSDGWARINQEGWQAPLYWERLDGQWWHMTLGGMRPVDEHAPVCHVSYFEADAFAHWAGKRLPEEAEWETATADIPMTGNFMDTDLLQPAPAQPGADPRQLFGDVWEWTRSAYAPYPGYRPAPGALGEYNGKFMSNQMVLRGGCCATPADHIRPTYRNFFYPGDRWPFCGFRLAEDIQ